MIKKKFYEGLLDDLDQPDFRPNNSELKNLFEFFNMKYFKGDLPKCNVVNNNLDKNILGCFCANTTVLKKRINNEIKVIDDESLNNIIIYINNKVAFSKRQLCETLIHEMIHLYQFVEHPSSIFIEGGHETFFLEKANHISSISEFNITPTCDQKLEDRTVNDIYNLINSDPLLCVLYKNDERFGVAKIPYYFIKPIASIILKSGKYSKVEFFECKNKKLLDRIDSIFGNNKDVAIIKALKVLQSPSDFNVREFTCASWYDIERFFNFEEYAKFLLGIKKDGTVYESFSSKKRYSIIKESKDRDLVYLKLDLLKSGDNKIKIDDIESEGDDKYSVMFRII